MHCDHSSSVVDVMRKFVTELVASYPCSTVLVELSRIVRTKYTHLKLACVRRACFGLTTRAFRLVAK